MCNISSISISFDLGSYQSAPYNLQPVLQIQHLFDVRHMELLDESALAKLAADNNKQP